MGRRQNHRWEQMDKSKMDLSLLIQHFEVHNRTEGKSPRTVEWYNEVLSMFRGWLEGQGFPTALGSIGELQVRQFILHIQGRPGLKNATLSSHSVANRVRALRAFFAWLARKGYTPDHLLKHVRVPKTSEKVVEPLTQNEVDRLFAAINSSTALGARNAALISLMLDTGLRISCGI